MYVLLSVYPNIAESYYLRYKGRYHSYSNKSHGVLPQQAASFTHTAVYAARINKGGGQSITGLHPQNPDILNNNTQLDSHKYYCNPNTVTR